MLLSHIRLHHIPRRRIFKKLIVANMDKIFSDFYEDQFSQFCSQKFRTKHEPPAVGGGDELDICIAPFRTFVRKWSKEELWVYQILVIKTKIAFKNRCVSIWRHIILGQSVKLCVNDLRTYKPFTLLPAEPHSSWNSQEIPGILWNSIIAFTKFHDFSLCWATWVKSMPSFF